MAASLDGVLIPVDVSGSVEVGGTLADALPVENVVLLGYWSIPDQSTARQHRDQFGEEAQRHLQTVADRFTDRAVDVQTRLVFTKDRDQLIDAAVNEYGCHSVLVPGTGTTTATPPRGIVLLKPDADLDRIVTTLAELFAESDVELQLFHDAETSNEHLYDATRYMLRGLVDRLDDLGVERERVEWEQSTDGPRLDVILSQVSDFDFVILSETEPSVRERVFGTVQSMLADETEKPLLTIRTGN